MSEPSTATTGATAPSERTRLRRKAERGAYDRPVIDAIIDEAVICHVGFAVDARPWVIPTAHARIDDQLYLHGAPANHMLRTLDGGIETCVTFTLLDGLVLARSAFHHSINFRSVLLFGRAERVADPAEQLTALEALVEHIVPGRNADARGAAPQELRKTLVLRMPISEASAKIRTGGPIDDDDDLALDVWAGEIPLRLVAGEPVADALLPAGVPVPDYAAVYRRG